MLLRAECLVAPAAGTPFEQVASVNVDHQTAADPWTDTVEIPSGANRAALHMVWTFANAITADTLDGNALTSLQDVNQSGERIAVFGQLEAAMAAAGASKTLSMDYGGTNDGRGRYITVHGARQEFSSGNNSSGVTSNVITVSATRTGGGNFPAGTLVYAGAIGSSSSATCTVTGDVTEVLDQERVTGEDRQVYAEGALAAPAASVSATFTFSVGFARRSAVIVAVEPAP